MKGLQYYFMHTPHFYAYHSHIGLKYPPIYTTALNIGVEGGADAILTPQFLSSWNKPKVTKYTFSNPSTIPDNVFFEKVAQETEEARDLLDKTLQDDEVDVVIGGDHSVTFPSILSVLGCYKPSTLAYIQIDSHGDMNRLDESISKNWHGLYLRPLLDPSFDIPEINKLITTRLDPKRMVFVGNLDLDPLEEKFFKKQGIKNLSVSDMRTSHTQSISYLKDLISKSKHTHVSIDIDGFDSSIAPATGLPSQKGLLLDDVTDLLTLIAESQSFSIDLVEVNPKKEGADKTIKLAQDILHKLLKNLK